MKANLVKTRQELDDKSLGSIFLWNYKEDRKSGHIMLNCPGCGDTSAMLVYASGEAHPPNSEAWQITGLPNNITLTPSINCVGCCGWHGYLTNGEYKRC